MEEITISFNLSQWLSLAFVSLVVMFLTKLAIAFGYLILGPKLDGQSFFGFAGLGAKATARLPLTILVAGIAAFVIAVCGGGLVATLVTSAILGCVFTIL